LFERYGGSCALAWNLDVGCMRQINIWSQHWRQLFFSTVTSDYSGCLSRADKGLMLNTSTPFAKAIFELFTQLEDLIRTQTNEPGACRLICLVDALCIFIPMPEVAATSM